MLTASLDFEARSRVDLKKAGAWEYCRHVSTVPLCLAWAAGDDEPELWNPAFPTAGVVATPEPARLFDLIKQGARLYAWNASFERQFWRHVMVELYGWPEVPDEQWFCSMAKAQAYGLPGSLDKAALAMGSVQKKDKSGYLLMKKMSRPRKPTKNNPAEWHEDSADDFRRLFAYCKQDVRTERATVAPLNDLSDYERRVWLLDQKINQYGVPVDRELCEAAVRLDKIAKADMGEQLREATGGKIAKVDRVPFIAWLKANGVEPPKKIKKERDEDTGEITVTEIETTETKSLKKLFTQDLPPLVKRVVELYMAANKTSVTKYRTMLERSATSGRLHEMFMYHAAQPGRFAGRGVQLHNLPRPPESMSNMEELAEDILHG